MSHQGIQVQVPTYSVVGSPAFDLSGPAAQSFLGQLFSMQTRDEFSNSISNFSAHQLLSTTVM